MSLTDDQIVRLADEGDPVADHAVFWYPVSWTKAIAEKCPIPELQQALFRVISTTAADAAKPRISRQMVVDTLQTAPATDAYLAAIIWGCGTGAQNRTRMLRVFTENDDVVNRITDLVKACRRANPGEAWELLRRRHRLKHLGIAFGTKIAYFAALAERGPYGELPLIADINVMRGLGERVTYDKSAYVTYCSRALRLSKQLKIQDSRPDQIEFALFRAGRRKG